MEYEVFESLRQFFKWAEKLNRLDLVMLSAGTKSFFISPLIDVL